MTRTNKNDQRAGSPAGHRVTPTMIVGGGKVSEIGGRTQTITSRRHRKFSTSCSTCFRSIGSLHPVSGALVRRGALSLCQSAQSST
jgi:hypothetical protein